MGVLAKGTRVVLFVLICSLIPAQIFGQAIATGTVQGTVTDPAGAAVVDATVTLTDTSTSTTRTAPTNDTGRYIFANIPPGLYDVSVSKAGFRVTKFPKQEVTVGATLTLNTRLEIGSNVETVEVYASGATLETMNATIGNTISGDALDALPGLGRDVSTFVSLQPGVAPDGSVAGANQDQNSFQLDGGNNSSDMDGTMNTYTPGFAGDPSGGAVNSYSTGTGVSGAPGRRTIGCHADAHRQYSGIQRRNYEPDRRFQQFRRRPGADDYQARRQYLARYRIRILFGQQLEREHLR